MDLQTFKELVYREFGDHLEHATPANVREFLDRLQVQEVATRLPGERFEIHETGTTYEEIIKDFFARVLEMPRDDAIILLWTLAIDLAFAAVEHQYAEYFASLFKELDQY